MKVKNNNEQKSQTRRKRAKTKNQIRIKRIKEILRKGTKEHKDAIDMVIQQYDDYVNLPTLEKEYIALKTRIELAKDTKEKEAKRQKTEDKKSEKS